MKLKILSFLFVLTIAVGANAQGTYFNYWDSTSVYKIYSDGGYGVDPYMHMDYQTQYFDGDTLIGGHYYYKQYTLQLDSAFNTYGNFIIKTITTTGPNYVRETPNLHFVRLSGSFQSEYIIFDDSSVVYKDTMGGVFNGLSYTPCNIDYVDSVKLGSRFLKREGGGGNFLNYQYGKYLIEGIGILNPMGLVCNNQIVFDAFAIDVCYKKQKDSIDFNTGKSCSAFLQPVRHNHFTKIVVPVELISLSVGFDSRNLILLSWQTATEINTSHFNIQRSTNGKDFTNIGKVNAKGASTYTFNDPIRTDDSRFTKLYYRLEVVDKDGSKTYSEIRSVYLTTDDSGFTISPNPAKDYVTITGSNIKQVKLLDNMGRVVVVKEVNNTPINIPVNRLSKGLYMVQATYIDGSVKTEKVVVE